MRVVKDFCDHCGKELDNMRDYVDVDIEFSHIFVNADLCTDCFDELNEIVLKFCKKEMVGENDA